MKQGKAVQKGSAPASGAVSRASRLTPTLEIDSASSASGRRPFVPICVYLRSSAVFNVSVWLLLSRLSRLSRFNLPDLLTIFNLF